MDIGYSLKEQREIAGISQSELSKKTGIKQQSISRWENNTHIPNVADCLTLAKFYGISIEKLIGADEN